MQLVSKFGINRTNKRLIYSTTEFEGFLSDVSGIYCTRSDITLFPGDADLITFDGNLNNFNLFEFKKHTGNGSGSIRDQSFLNYINMDRKKYNGLAALVSRLGKNKFYNVLWSTRWGEEKIIKIETVSSQLTLLRSDVIEFATLTEIKSRLKEYINAP